MSASHSLKDYFDLFKTSFEDILKSPTEEKYDEWYEKQREIYDKIEDPEDESKPSEKELVEALDYVKKVFLSNPQHPRLQHGGHDNKMLVEFTEQILQLFSRIWEDKEEYATSLGSDLYLAALSTGPQLWQSPTLEAIRRYTSVSEYWGKMTAADLRKYFSAMLQKSPYPRHESEIDDLECHLRYDIEPIIREVEPQVFLEIADETAEYVMVIVERTNSDVEKVSDLHRDIWNRLDRKVFYNNNYLYNHVSSQKVWKNHLERNLAILTGAKQELNRYCKDTIKDQAEHLVGHVRHGKNIDKKDALAALQKYFSRISSDVLGDNKRCVERVRAYADEHFGTEMELAAAEGDAISTMIVAIRDLTDHRSDRDRFEKKFKDLFENQILTAVKPEKYDQLTDLICAAVEVGFEIPLKWVAKIVEKRKGLDFKTRNDLANRILDVVMNVDETCKSERPYEYYDFFESVIKAFKSQKVLKDYEEKLIEITKAGLSKQESYMHRLIGVPSEEIRWDENIGDTKEVLTLMLERLTQEVLYASCDLHFGIWRVILGIMRVFNKTKKSAKEIALNMASIMHYCKDQDFQHPADADKKTSYWEILKLILEDYLMWNRDNVEVLKPMIEDVKELWTCGDEIMERDANNLMTMIKGSHIELLGEHSATLIDNYLSGDESTVLTNFGDMYKANPALFEGKLDAILEKAKGADEWIVSSTLQFFTTVVKEDPKVITQPQVDAMAPYLSMANAKYMACWFLQEVATVHPEWVDKHTDKMIAAVEADAQVGGVLANTFVSLACMDRAHAEKITKFFAEYIPKTPVVQRISMIYSLRTIATKYKDVVAKYRDMLEEQKKESQLQDHCQGVIDILEERTLENLDVKVKEQGEDIENLDQRVTETEENVVNLENEVDETKRDVKHVKEDVAKVEGRVDDMEVVVAETSERVEELEHRTLSHAPEWSQDVCKLLNPEADHDWRLLAQRLGYSNDDIRNWATQPNPCMSLFDEWFATHKTREATFAISKTLKEINRTDAARIVEEALKAVEDIIQDQPEDYANPPPVFISYQWGIQQEVRLLKRHLRDAGYDGWMDIGQMGGGDKLYEKIDQGIRAAKVVVCCVTGKYAESPNCNREVNLSVTLGKPIIPLLMEKMSWPPPGSMGPIFGEYLFIRFFTRQGEETGDQRFWSAAKFQELLMQLRYSIAPEEGLITDVYKGWWDPPEEEIVIKPKKKETQKSATKEVQQDEPELLSPSVFISYQWGKQTQIKALYRKLTRLGYHCWLDINQMGGGDSLYDKIDKGVRGAKVVLSCVTTKYALSANCRREVSLADALKKPIIPLLLEKMAWPPEGPMGLPFTQLLYINFCKPSAEVQHDWECPQFNELIQKIKSHVPDLDLEVETENNDQARVKQEEKDHEEFKESQPTKEVSEKALVVSPATNSVNTTEDSKHKQMVNEEKSEYKKYETNHSAEEEKYDEVKSDASETIEEGTPSSILHESNIPPPPPTPPKHDDLNEKSVSNQANLSNTTADKNKVISRNVADEKDQMYEKMMKEIEEKYADDVGNEIVHNEKNTQQEPPRPETAKRPPPQPANKPAEQPKKKSSMCIII